MNGFEIKLIDQSALDAFDTLLNPKQRRQVVTSAKNAAGTVIRNEAHKRAPVGPTKWFRKPKRSKSGSRTERPGGTLKKSLRNNKTGLKITRRKNVYVLAGRTSKERATQGSHSIGGYEAYYAYWVEHGHGGPRGPAKARPYMVPAFRAKRQEASRAFADKFQNAVASKLKGHRIRKR